MNQYGDIHDAHLRLTILRLLNGAPSYSANDSVLTESVRSMGLHCTRDQMRGQLGWLEEQRAVTLVHPTVGLAVATLTDRGADFAVGRSTIAGIQRPSPGTGI